MEQHLIRIIPNTMVDDYFAFGFISGFLSFLYYRYMFRNDPKNHISILSGIYGALLSGSLGGLLAILFDQSISLSIFVGLANQFIYIAILRSTKNGDFWKVVKEMVIKLLGGALPTPK